MALLILLGMGGFLPHASADTPASQPADGAAMPALSDPWNSPEVAAPRMDADAVLRRPDGVVSTVSGDDASRSGMRWIRTTASLAGVVALIVLLAWGYRMVSGASGRLGSRTRVRQQSLIELLSRTPLSPRQALYLVRVGPQLVLIGSTQESIRALSVIDDPELAARLAGQQAHERGRPVATTAFARDLTREASAYDQDENDGDSGLKSLQKRLTEALRRTTTGQT